jgi:hypothetical protein
LKALFSLIKRLVSTMSSFSAFRCHFSRGKLAGGPWFGAVFHRAILAGCLRCSGLQKNIPALFGLMCLINSVIRHINH